MPTTSDVETALAALAGERGRALLDIDEDQWFERKSARVAPRELADILIGMANAEGGTVVVGLHDDAVEGVTQSGDRLNAWRQTALDFTVPPVPVELHFVDCVNHRGEHDRLLVVEVQPSERVHANARDEVFLRLGDENRLLRFEQRQELVYDKGQASFEATVLKDVSTRKLDAGLMKGYAAATGHPDARRLLVARGLLTSGGDVTVGAFLLFGRNPQASYPAANIRVVTFRGSGQATGARQQLVEDLRFDGPIPVLLDAARNAIGRLVPTRRALGRGARFETVPFVPEAAWFEGVVNGVVHRSYSMAGDHIRVEIFDDRVEIESPGRFPGIVDGSDPLRIARYARNPRIARACAELRYGQELGEGIRRMYHEMRLAGLPDPVYRQTSGSVRLTLLATPVDRALEGRVTARGRQILEVIDLAGRMGTGELVSTTGWSRPTVLRELRALTSLGLVAWTGSSRTDPWAYWARSPDSNKL